MIDEDDEDDEDDSEASDGESLDGAVTSQCPYCGETVELTVDAVGPSEQRYTEDCSVCCRPWVVTVTRGEDGVDVWLAREDD